METRAFSEIKIKILENDLKLKNSVFVLITPIYSNESPYPQNVTLTKTYNAVYTSISSANFETMAVMGSLPV